MKQLAVFAGTPTSKQQIFGRSSAIQDLPNSRATLGVVVKRSFISAAAVASFLIAGTAAGSAQEVVNFSNVAWSGPITITQGGTYTGNWRSTNPNVPAVTVNTSAPVTIINSNIESAADLIEDIQYGADITVKNTQGLALNPNVAGQANGLFLSTYNPARVDVENNTMENVRFGVWVRNWVGAADGYHTATIKRNRCRNLLGLKSDGNGGYQYTNGNNFEWAHFVQLGGMHGIPGIDISWNEVINEPYKSFNEEVINMYQNSGTASSPTQIHDNYIQGAYPYDPATQPYNGGGFATDGDSSDTAATASAYIMFHDNQVISTTNQGASIGMGHDNQIYNNRVISSGLLPDGRHIFAQNVGVSMGDGYGSGGPYYNNDVHNNVVGWMCWASGCGWDGYRNDMWYGVTTNDWNTNNPLPFGVTITQAMEAAELQTWKNKLAANNVQVGVVTSSSTPISSTPSSPTGSTTSTTPITAPATSSSSSSTTTTISPTAWYNVVNSNSHLCVDMRAQATGDGTAVQQETCGNSQYFQEWQMVPTDSGYYRIYPRTSPNEVWDVTGGTWVVNDQAPIQTWYNKTGSNQQWMPVPLGNGNYKFVARNSGKCLDVPWASTQSGVQLQQYTCNGTGAQSFQLIAK